jgi:hypothetical protein
VLQLSRDLERLLLRIVHTDARASALTARANMALRLMIRHVVFHGRALTQREAIMLHHDATTAVTHQGLALPASRSHVITELLDTGLAYVLPTRTGAVRLWPFVITPDNALLDRAARTADRSVDS